MAVIVSGNVSVNSTGVLPISRGGTNADNAIDAANNLLPDQAGKTGYVLTTDGAGVLSWEAAGGGGGSGTVTSVAVSGGTTGLTTSGGPITSSGTITLAGTLAVANGGTGQTTAEAALNAFLPNQTANSGKILTTNGTTSSWSSLGVTQVIYVTKAGNDSTADGSITKPFLTIGAAMSYINATFPQGSNSGVPIIIMLAPGNYVENVTINRFLTQIWGYEGKSKATRISGTVTIQGATDHSGVFQNVVTLSNLFIAGVGNANSVVLSGTIPTSLEINNCSLYTAGTGSPLLINNTAAAGNRLRVPYCEIIAQGNAPAVDISNVNNGAIGNINSSSASTGDAWKFTNTTCTVGVVQLTASAATNVLTLAGTSTISMGYSSLSSSKANGNGVSISSTSTFIAIGCGFNIPTGSGYAVYGPAGSVYMKGGNYAVFGTNSTSGPTLTALSMPAV